VPFLSNTRNEKKGAKKGEGRDWEEEVERERGKL